MQLRNALQRLLPRRATSRTGRTGRRALPRVPILAFLAILGPGLVSAIAGDDAGGIGTYSVVGAKYGYELLWALVIVIIALAVVQEMTARLAVTTGKGLADLIREEFGVRTTAFAMFALFIANGAVTISEFVGIAAASELFGVNRYFSVPLAAFAVWYIVTRGNYRVAEKIFLALAAVLGVYVFAAVLSNPDWNAVARGTFIPTIHTDRDFILLTIAVIGTTISPYMQFTLSATTLDKGTKPAEYGFVFWETLIGVVLSGVFAYFIVVATGATLHINGITQIESAEQAARALEPIAGPLAQVLFGIGLLGASFLAACILPLSTTYAICEAFGWERGLNQERSDARIFYGLFTALIVIGAIVALIPGLPLFQIFVYVYLLNGILLPVLLILMLRLANNKRLMGKHVNSPVVNVMSWGITIVLIVLTAALIVTTIFGV